MKCYVPNTFVAHEPKPLASISIVAGFRLSIRRQRPPPAAFVDHIAP